MTTKRFENRLSKDNVKFNTLNPVWDNEKQDAFNVFEMIDMLNHLHEKNGQLKKENMEYYHLINCGNCKYHNYDWFDDGDEFEVCDKGHIERLMYNKFCKEWKEL